MLDAEGLGDALRNTILNLEDLTICLLLTRQCNFKCAHCMYECGPEMPSEYMGNNVLGAVHKQVCSLKKQDIYPTVNLVGGEPTLNMGCFSEILSEVATWEVSVEMTTNGWWLYSQDNARAFFRAVSPYVESTWGNSLDGLGFRIRISNDPFHDEYRPRHLQHKTGQPPPLSYHEMIDKNDRMATYLSSLWEFDEYNIFYDRKFVCGGCGEEFEEHTDRCPHCDGYVDTEYTEAILIPPEPHKIDPWIYVDRFNNTPPIPVGRARKLGRTKFPDCHGANTLSYLPNGTLMDICCRGSWCEFGDVQDDPLLLLAVSNAFIKEEYPTCAECRSAAAAWANDNLAQTRTQMEELIAERR